MTNIINTNFRSIAITSIATFIAFIAFTTSVSAYTALTGQLDPGARGTNVTNLQTFFKDNSAIYPEGLVTGYYGSMTKAGVIRFQNTYGFQQVGRVGPQTLGKINELINAGGWGGIVSSGDTLNPMIYPATGSISTYSATFNWNTNENARAKVFYSTSPIVINEGDENSNGFALRNGNVASNDNELRTSSSVTINNLQANTMYYYMLVATDASGNVSVYGVNNTFRTNN